MNVQGVKDKQVFLDEIVETLSSSGLPFGTRSKTICTSQPWPLSGGQQQRLCIARAISVKPHILLMDEPASALDPIATAQLEETMLELKKDFTIIIVTHSMQRAARASDWLQDSSTWATWLSTIRPLIFSKMPNYSRPMTT